MRSHPDDLESATTSKIELWPITRFVLGFAIALGLTVAFMAFAAKAADYKAGPYAGVVIGYGTGQISPDGIDIAQEGATVGGVLGLSHNFGGFVAGLEGDFGYTGVKGSFADRAVKSSGSWEGSIRARAGIPVGPALFFGTAGLAFKESSLDVLGIKASDTALGFVGGGGVDFQLTNTVQLRLEALHYAYPDTKIDFTDLGTAKFDDSKTVVRAGLTFSLN